MLLPSALGFSPHPPVSVYGTGSIYSIAAFLDRPSGYFTTFFRSFFLSHYHLGLSPKLCDRLLPRLLSWAIPTACVPTVLIYTGAGISTCCPSATLSGLALGPDFPRADQLYPGSLGYSAWRILTSISLLIPAFSLHSAPLLLIGTVSTPL